MKYLILLLLFGLSAAVKAQIFVVVSTESAIPPMTESEVADIYLGRKRTVDQAEVTQVFDREGELRERFFTRVAKMQTSQVNAYWAKLKFSGRMRAHDLVENDEELVRRLVANPSSIGYMQTPPPKELKVVINIHE